MSGYVDLGFKIPQASTKISGACKRCGEIFATNKAVLVDFENDEMSSKFVQITLNESVYYINLGSELGLVTVSDDDTVDVRYV